jgi:predicted GNAT superfamily acetyltransferase
VVQAADGRPVEPAAESGATIVRPRADGFPDAELNDGEALLVWIPDDVVSLRQSDPAKAEAWRGAVRLAVSSALADGYRGEAITRDGWLVLSR